MVENGPGDWSILHAFADTGVESEALSAYGEVTRVGIDPVDNPYTDELITADIRDWEPSQTFDLALFHPPCYKWTQRSNEDGLNLIPLAREIANNYSKHYIIENQPDAPLRNPTILKGEMFGLPVAYERAFETSYSVEQPPYRSSHEYRHRVENTRPKSYWGAVKGYSHEPYNGQVLATNSTPRAYIEWLLQPLLHDDAKPDVQQSSLI